MKFTLVLFFGVFTLITSAQEDVLVVFEQNEVTQRDTLNIQIHLGREQEVEIAIFTNEKLFMAETSRLAGGRTDYKLPLMGIWPSRFTLLVDGETFHEEFSFVVRE